MGGGGGGAVISAPLCDIVTLGMPSPLAKDP
eukprot:COSAG02_NODE_29797_length_562_cov_7.475162_1_plen_30_part_10